MIQVFVKDWYGKSHIFRLLQTATVLDLENQLSVKFKVPQSEYWLSGPGGNKMENHEKLVDLSTIHMRGRLFGGSDKCCIKGCSEEASGRTITCLAGVYELKITPDILCQANVNDLPLHICNHHYYFQRKRGHKQKQYLRSSVKCSQKIFRTSKKTETDDCFSLVGVKTCTSCKENIVVTKTTPCLKHILKVSSKYYMCACNCLDKIRDGKIEDINSDMYDCISNREELKHKSDLEQNYICTECSPTYLASIKADKISQTGSQTGSQTFSQTDSQTGSQTCTQTGSQTDSQTGSQTCSADSYQNENTDKTSFPTSAETHPITFPFSELFSGSDYTSSKRNRTFQNYELISNMFISLFKKEFAPWEVYLQHSKTGVMLHFNLKSSSHTLPTKTLTTFFPFLFGVPYQMSFSVYVLGKQLDNGFLPNDFFENEIQALNRISDLLNTLFSLQFCLGIYDEKSLKSIKRRQLSNTFDTDSTKNYEIDSNYLLTNRYGKHISETIRSVNPQRPCKRQLSQPRAERCQNCTILLQNTNLFHEHKIPSDKCCPDSHTALTKLSFEQLLERYKNLKKSCDYWKSRTRYYMNRKKLEPPVNFNVSS